MFTEIFYDLDRAEKKSSYTQEKMLKFSISRGTRRARNQLIENFIYIVFLLADGSEVISFPYFIPVYGFWW